jgi:hypothetical protein
VERHHEINKKQLAAGGPLDLQPFRESTVQCTVFRVPTEQLVLITQIFFSLENTNTG